MESEAFLRLNELRIGFNPRARQSLEARLRNNPHNLVRLEYPYHLEDDPIPADIQARIAENRVRLGCFSVVRAISDI